MRVIIVRFFVSRERVPDERCGPKNASEQHASQVSDERCNRSLELGIGCSRPIGMIVLACCSGSDVCPAQAPESPDKSAKSPVLI
jgi:hypothetical protein